MKPAQIAIIKEVNAVKNTRYYKEKKVENTTDTHKFPLVCTVVTISIVC